MYVNEGLLDFVQSDDELAGVIGHETGHIERRHTVTMQSKSQSAEPLVRHRLAVLAVHLQLRQHLAGRCAGEDLAHRRTAGRSIRLAADVARRYDPEAMLTMQEHLGALEGEHNDLVTKYFQDHPGSSARVAHLLGYKELDPTKTTRKNGSFGRCTIWTKRATTSRAMS